MSKVMREVVRERFDGKVIASDLVEITPDELAVAKSQVSSGVACKHELVYDEPGFMYDIRTCAVCGAGLGTV